MGLLYGTLALFFYKHGAISQLYCFKDECLENKTIEILTSWYYVYRKTGLLLWMTLYTITYKSRLTQKKLYKKSDAIFSIYG